MSPRQLLWECLGILQEELESMVRHRLTKSGLSFSTTGIGDHVSLHSNYRRPKMVAQETLIETLGCNCQVFVLCKCPHIKKKCPISLNLTCLHAFPAQTKVYWWTKGDARWSWKKRLHFHQADRFTFFGLTHLDRMYLCVLMCVCVYRCDITTYHVILITQSGTALENTASHKKVSPTPTG